MSLTRRHLLAGAAATAAVAALPAAAAIEAVGEAPIEWSVAFADRQTFFDGKVDWIFYARRREWIGIDRESA